MKDLIIIVSTAFIFEIAVILFKIKLLDPYREKKERQANPDVVALKEQYYMLEAARKNKMEEAKSIENVINKISASAPYMPLDEQKTMKESLEDYKKKHYSIIKVCEEYDILIQRRKKTQISLSEGTAFTFSFINLTKNLLDKQLKL